MQRSCKPCWRAGRCVPAVLRPRPRCVGINACTLVCLVHAVHANLSVFLRVCACLSVCVRVLRQRPAAAVPRCAGVPRRVLHAARCGASCTLVASLCALHDTCGCEPRAMCGAPRDVASQARVSLSVCTRLAHLLAFFCLFVRLQVWLAVAAAGGLGTASWLQHLLHSFLRRHRQTNPFKGSLFVSGCARLSCANAPALACACAMEACIACVSSSPGWAFGGWRRAAA